MYTGRGGHRTIFWPGGWLLVHNKATSWLHLGLSLFLCVVHPQFSSVPWTLWLCLGFWAKLRIWQVLACKMKPRSTCILECGTPSWACTSFSLVSQQSSLNMIIVPHNIERSICLLDISSITSIFIWHPVWCFTFRVYLWQKSHLITKKSLEKPSFTSKNTNQPPLLLNKKDNFFCQAQLELLPHLQQAGLSWCSVQAETVRLQSWIEPGLIDNCWNLLN